jgi:NADH:ubiquinone oxidoreductase subunit H
MLAETNRTPFDLTEAEAELVAGYNVEYSALTFAMFFLAEYSNMLIMSIMGSIFYLGSFYTFLFVLQFFFFIYLFVLIRATFPRYKYNELMDLG